MVMRRICCHGPAPSSAAASYRSRGMSWRPARYSTKLKPRVHQTVAIATEIIAQFGSPSQFGGVTPTVDNQSDSSPMAGVYSHTQMSAITAEGSTYGAKKQKRKNARPRDTRSASRANTNARTTRGGVVRMVNQMVCHREDQKSELPSASA